MNVVDVNLLLFAYDSSAPLHDEAKAWLDREFRSTELTGLAYPTVVRFVRIMTNTRAMMVPLDVREACEIVESWLELPSVSLLSPTERHWKIFRRLGVESQSHGNLIPDADLAATTIEHGATLCTHDRDFSRFEGLRVRYPLTLRE